MISVVVARIKDEARDVKSFQLVSKGGEALPEFAAGAHIDVRLPSGLVRQYSLCNSPQESHRYVIAVLLEPESSGGSAAMHGDVSEGMTLEISVPRNHFHLAEGARKSILFAGGIGITPILAMAEQLHANMADFELHYCGRSRERMAFLDYLSTSDYADRVHIYPDDESDTGKLQLQYILAQPRPDNHVYVCGPSGFIGYVIESAESLFWQPRSLHREYFKGNTEHANEGDLFQVRLSSSGEVYDIPEGVSVVDVLADAGISIPVSCEQGVCGTCLTRVIDGELDHRDMFLSDEEHEQADQFTPCCSRGKGTITLDL